MLTGRKGSEEILTETWIVYIAEFQRSDKTYVLKNEASQRAVCSIAFSEKIIFVQRPSSRGAMTSFCEMAELVD